MKQDHIIIPTTIVIIIIWLHTHTYLYMIIHNYTINTVS